MSDRVKSRGALNVLFPAFMVLALGIWGCSSTKQKKQEVAQAALPGSPEQLSEKPTELEPWAKTEKVSEEIVQEGDGLVIQFRNASNAVPESQVKVTDMIAQQLVEKPNMVAVIEGHSDNQGKEEYNQALSEKRAEAVREMLVTNYNIDVARLSVKGKGAAEPVADNATVEGRQQNRRVVVKIEEQQAVAE